MKGVKKVFLTAVFLMSFFVVAKAQDQVSFNEIWAYLMKGEESFLSDKYPITDLAYFAAELDTFGNLTGVPNRTKIKNFKGKVHLVIAQVNNRSLTHFAIDPKFSLRNKLIDDIAKAAQNFDGVQIDFELVPNQDAANFYSFLSALKKRIGKKPLSVAVSARTKFVNDAYAYDKLAKIADRIIIMAYDEHWSTSAPGSIASLAWCQKVADYAISIIPSSKLVMGLPFYGRAWANVNPAKAYKHTGIIKLIEEKDIETIKFDEGIPYFKYQEEVEVTVYFENANSIINRMKMYQEKQIKNIAFWRLGQEEQIVWEGLGVDR
jgi:spore germination protein YaaH